METLIHYCTVPGCSTRTAGSLFCSSACARTHRETSETYPPLVYQRPRRTWRDYVDSIGGA